MVQVFICSAKGDMLVESAESKELEWISLSELDFLLNYKTDSFYVMHVDTLRKYLEHKLQVNYQN